MAFINDSKFGDIGALPSPSGLLGSKTNPYKINKPAQGHNIYIPENSVEDNWGRGLVTVPKGSKLYFEVDPIGITDKLVGAFKIGAVFSSGAATVCKLTQNKATGAYSSESCQGYSGLLDIIYDGQPYPISNTKFLYAIAGSPEGDTNIAVWATIPHEDMWITTPKVAPQVIQPPPSSIISAPIQTTPGGGDIMAIAPSTYDPYIDFLMARGVTGADLQAALAARNITLSTPLPSVPGTTPGVTQPGVSSIMAGFPTWAWIVIAGIGVTMFFGRKKKRVSE